MQYIGGSGGSTRQHLQHTNEIELESLPLSAFVSVPLSVQRFAYGYVLILGNWIGREVARSLLQSLLLANQLTFAILVVGKGRSIDL